MPKPLTKKPIEWIVAQVNAGKLSLPDLDQLDENDYCTVWALADSGSAARVADKDRQFPGAIRRKSRGQSQGQTCVTADKGELANKGEFDVAFKTQEAKTFRVL